MPTRRYWAPLLVNTLIGIPMTVVVLCARWYAAHGHCDYDDLRLRDLDGCSYDQIENSGWVLGALVVTGLLVLVLVLIADVILPRGRRRPLTPGLVTLPAVLLPYALLTAAAA
ncbi:hypothetical protein [Streptomyces sp. JB150]|uniref:hypothetical protein n=1 Tax=Streptomyces sp. JB150 TaxID=2714844 RepID=UPI001407B544|nr:hypothetical protein [Streptomyces sp. JB150]QIJ61018.1 hypothetical protein G7Z13_02440 [Streptomyces sp. JB150]